MPSEKLARFLDVLWQTAQLEAEFHLMLDLLVSVPPNPPSGQEQWDRLVGRPTPPTAIQTAPRCSHWLVRGEDWPVEAEVARWLPEDADAAREDRVHALVDLAKAGREEDFKFLAGAVGVAMEELDAFWTGTVSRLGKPTP